MPDLDPERSNWERATAFTDHASARGEASATVDHDGTNEINVGRGIGKLQVNNTGGHDTQVRPYFSLLEVNSTLDIDLNAAMGTDLITIARTSLRFETGDTAAFGRSREPHGRYLPCGRVVNVGFMNVGRLFHVGPLSWWQELRGNHQMAYRWHPGIQVWF